MSVLDRFPAARRWARRLSSPNGLRGLALASLIANVGLVVTGGAVRLTDSGLGCPTWPRCTADSYTTSAEMGVHGVIEFGNRTLTFVLGAIALAALVATWRSRPDLRTLAAAVLFGIPLQGVIGGITVLTNLNPWVVGLHFLGSIAVITAAYAFWRRTGPTAPVVVPGPLHTLAALTAAASAAVIAIGVVVTGSGPHSGDHGAKRNGLDPESISQFHADLVFLLLGLSVALWLALRAVGAPSRPAAVLLIVVLGQGVLGFAQYFTHLPILLVGLHMFGACLVWLATLSALAATRGVPVARAKADAPANRRQPAEATH